jgi:hypothetical protein
MRRHLASLALALLLPLAGGCEQVRFNQKARLGDRAMVFDHDHVGAEMEGHILTPREGAIGGFYAAGAGGCGCN